jgi:hypothetical protein
MVGTCADDFTIALEQLMRDHVLPPSKEETYSPKARDPSEHWSWILRKRMEWRQPVQSDGYSEGQ